MPCSFGVSGIAGRFYFPSLLYLPRPQRPEPKTTREPHIPMSKKEPIEQAGAIPFRRGPSGWEFLVITSRKGNWIFPKGVVGKEETPAEAARKECAEEAGVRGDIVGEAVGSYPDRRRKHPCLVRMFLLRYEGEADWEEEDFRERLWCGFAEAAERLRKEPVRELLTRALERLEQERDLS